MTRRPVVATRLSCALAVSLAAGLLGARPAGAAPSQLSEVVVTVEEDEQPLMDVLRRLEQAHGLNYVISQEVVRRGGTVTVHLKQVPLDVALESICAACGLSLEIRGPVLVILPRPGAAPEAGVVPRVESGVSRPALVEQAEQARLQAERDRAAGAPAQPGPGVAPPAPPPAVRREEPDLAQTVGTLLEIDRPERRLVLRVDGLKRDFFLPDREDPDMPGLQINRLEQSLDTLKPGTRIAILYRRDAIHPVVTDLVGGAFSGTSEARQQELARQRRARERRAAADAAAIGSPSAVLAGEPTAEPAEGAPAGTVKVLPAGPAASDNAAPEGPAAGGAGEEGILAGKFLGLKGEEVLLQRASDGERVSCFLPPESDAARRKRVQKTLGELEEGAKLYLTFELHDGQRIVTNTITEAR